MLRRSLAMPMIQQNTLLSKIKNHFSEKNIPNISPKKPWTKGGGQTQLQKPGMSGWTMFHLSHPLPPTTLLVSRGLGLEVKELTNKTRPGSLVGESMLPKETTMETWANTNQKREGAAEVKLHISIPGL